MDDIAVSIVRAIMLRNLDGAIQPDGAELLTLDVIARSRRASLQTRRFARGALAWLERRMHTSARL